MPPKSAGKRADLWSERYDRELKSILALQDDIARQIGEQLQTKLSVGNRCARPGK